MGFGLVCHWIEVEKKPRGGEVYVNKLQERGLQLGKWKSRSYTDKYIFETYLHNARSLKEIAPTIASLVKCYRVSSSILPLADVVDRSLWDNNEIRSEFAAAGEAFRSRGVRLTTHPGQFCVLSSDERRVIDSAIRDLETHGWVMDALGMPQSPEAPINIHGGKSGRSNRLIDSIVDLPPAVRTRLTLENDESSYSVADLLEVFSRTATPVVFDSHHHTFNDAGLHHDLAYEAALETWPRGVKPLQHVSNSEPECASGSFIERRKHSQFIHHIPERQLHGALSEEIDLECEVKMKNIAIKKFLSERIDK